MSEKGILGDSHEDECSSKIQIVQVNCMNTNALKDIGNQTTSRTWKERGKDCGYKWSEVRPFGSQG